MKRVLSTMLSNVRFEMPLESEFREHFERQSKVLRGHVWVVLLLGMLLLLVFHSLFLDLPPEILPMAELAAAGVMVPAALRWLSSAWSPCKDGRPSSISLRR